MKKVILGVVFLGIGATGAYLYDRQHPRIVTHTITGIDTRTVTEPASSDPDLTGNWANRAESTYTLRLIDTAGELSGSMVMPVTDGNGGIRPTQYPLTGSIQNSIVNITLDQGLGTKLSVSGELVVADTLRLEWTSSKGKLVEWIYRPA
jgi:hypothetical protein